MKLEHYKGVYVCVRVCVCARVYVCACVYVCVCAGPTGVAVPESEIRDRRSARGRPVRAPAFLSYTCNGRMAQYYIYNNTPGALI